ncbi:outer membrane biogenesis protein BamB [Stieleria maiorica]|uniref:Outer membrane biogenesis protein BamB n=1 Tax=Stieleria maiorica TaxID=2795974 RepID=A0A5B9MBC2_9BACT|nr:PQQ-binding-like beta-propeller repeat protein [Stieleria maiorica]QEF96497.1 outer membrane biogenesis protein BamB [Stieleria maiorica]
MWRASVWIPTGFAALVVGLATVGCAPPPALHDRPLIEPSGVDVPDARVVEAVSQQFARTAPPPTDIPQWPALFGPNRTSVTDARLNPVWPTDGPEPVWEVPVGTGYGSPVAAAGGVVFNSRVGDREIVQCHEIADGRMRWQYSYPTSAICDFEYSDGPYSTPIIDPDQRRVFNVGGQGQFSCLDLDTGDVLWKRDLHADYDVQADIFPVGASPLFDRDSRHPGGQLIFNLGAFHRDAGVVSLDPATGKTLWQATDQGASYGTPFVATIQGLRYAFVLTDEGLVSLDPDRGVSDWFYPFRRKGDLSRNATSPLVFGDRVLVVSAGLGAVCLKILPDRSYVELWRQRRTIDSQYNTLILGDGHLYAFTSGGQGGAEFRCIDLGNGAVAWNYHSVLRRGMGLATQNAILLLGERGHLASLAFNPEAPQVLSFTEQPLMREPCYCSPAIHGTKLILKDESRVAVFDLGN